MTKSNNNNNNNNNTTTKTTTKKSFINQPQNAITDTLQGLLYQHPTKLRKLSNHNVILSTTIHYNRVNILSGGGSGHEPSHASYISSHNMLTGAILGDMFASPSVPSILSAIRCVTEPKNPKSACLLIVKNYTGDRLNFGKACTMANEEGRQCDMIVVADDCAVERRKGVTGARGVAGTVLVHKVAGALAGMGLSLEEVKNGVRMLVCERVRSMGVAFTGVDLPGSVIGVGDEEEERLDDKVGVMEVGMGIHGEAGTKRIGILDSDSLADMLIESIQEFGIKASPFSEEEEEDDDEEEMIPTFKKNDDLVVLINNLGGTSNFEMSILTKSVITTLEKDSRYQCHVVRLYVGSYMTSFNMHGASISILSLGKPTDEHNTKIKQYLDIPSDAPAWINADYNTDNDHKRPSSIEFPCPEEPKDHNIPSASSLIAFDIPNFETLAKTSISQCCTDLIESEALLTKYDKIVGDGDCGTTMKAGAEEILSRLEHHSIDLSHPSLFFQSIADAIAKSMGGTSGILLDILFRKMGNELRLLKNDHTTTTTTTPPTIITITQLSQAFHQGIKSIQLHGGATLGSRTMLDALIPASHALLKLNNNNNNNEGNDFRTNLQSAALAARQGANGTADMKVASAGRSNYVNEEVLIGTPDPGAVVVAIVLEGMVKVLC